MSKKKVLSVISIVIIVILIILLCFVKKDNSSVEEVKQEKPVEFSTEPTSEEIPQEENSETEESTEVDIIEEVKIGVDFRFDTKQNGTITVNGNDTGHVEDTISSTEEIQQDPAKHSFIKKDVKNSNGWYYKSSEHVAYADTGASIQFIGNHSSGRYNIREIDSDTDIELLRYSTYYNTPFYNYTLDQHKIPFKTPFEIGKGFNNPENFYEDTDLDGEFGEESIEEGMYQILFETPVELNNGIIQCIGWYDFGTDNFAVNGYFRNNDGRLFIFDGHDNAYEYIIAYLSDIFENCIIPL